MIKAAGILYAILLVALIAAKLAGLIGSGWWIVLIPLWAPIIIVVVISIVVVALVGNSGSNPFQ